MVEPGTGASQYPHQMGKEDVYKRQDLKKLRDIRYWVRKATPGTEESKEPPRKQPIMKPTASLSPTMPRIAGDLPWELSLLPNIPPSTKVLWE